MKNLIALITSIPLGCGAVCLSQEQDNKETLAQFTEVAEQYLEKYSNIKENQKWEKVWNSRIEKALDENGSLNENSYTNQVVVDWLISKKSIKLEEMQKQDKIQCCRYFLLYQKRNLDFPNVVKDHMTKGNLLKVLELLKSELVKH